MTQDNLLHSITGMQQQQQQQKHGDNKKRSSSSSSSFQYSRGKIVLNAYDTCPDMEFKFEQEHQHYAEMYNEDEIQHKNNTNIADGDGDGDNHTEIQGEETEENPKNNEYRKNDAHDDENADIEAKTALLKNVAIKKQAK